MNRRGLLIGLAVALGIPTVLIVQKEWVLSRGQPMLLELAPVDPRSLMQGDYMRLDYALSRAAASATDQPVREGKLVVKLDENQVATFVRFHHGEPLAEREHLLRFRRREDRLRLGAEAYYFQEGTAARYEPARYGELRVTAGGDSVLAGLRDAQRRPLGEASK
jgi:uncharacterized membrane-anchored protein